MHKQYQTILNSLLIVVISLFFAINVMTVSIVLIFYYVGFLSTVIIMRFLNNKSLEYKDTLTIFLLTFFFGSLLALSVNIDFIDNGAPFRYRDQMTFFLEAKNLASSNTIKELLYNVTNNYMEYNIPYGIFGLLAYVDRITTGTINFLPLLLSVTYVTALIPVFLYHILKLYLRRKSTFQGSIYYGLFTPIMAYSGFLLRDMHLTLIFMIILFWIVRKVTVVRLTGILLFIPIVANYRLANSFLVLAMLLVYVFSGRANKFVKNIFKVVGIVLLVYFSSNIYDKVIATQTRLEKYEDFKNQESEKSSGLGKKINNLPPVLKEAGTIFIGLTQFPFWGTPPSNMTIPQYTMTLYTLITNIGWFFVFIGVLYYVKPIYYRVNKMQSKVFLHLIFLFVFYMILSVNRMNLRTIVYIFPFIYIPFLLVYNDLSVKKRILHKQRGILSALFLSLSYLLLLLR